MLKFILILWPILVSLFALTYQKKQNGTKPLTGGPISRPKSFWLAYTISTWFFLPLFFYFSPNTLAELKYVLLFHLISWWLRGPIELFMIYRFFNWTPKYGISHDAFHIIGLLFFLKKVAIHPVNLDAHNFIVWLFLIVTVIATVAEILFAYLFLKARSLEEEQDNIYFASDDPKWIFINRVTLTVVIFVMSHLLIQAFMSWLYL